MSKPTPQIPPAPGTYAYVMRRIPLDPWLAETVYGYDEAVDTRDTVHPDGERKATIFFSSASLLQRLLCIGGWENVTDMWAEQAEQDAPRQIESKSKVTRSLRVAG